MSSLDSFLVSCIQSNPTFLDYGSNFSTVYKGANWKTKVKYLIFNFIRCLAELGSFKFLFELKPSQRTHYRASEIGMRFTCVPGHSDLGPVFKYVWKILK